MSLRATVVDYTGTALKIARRSFSDNQIMLLESVGVESTKVRVFTQTVSHKFITKEPAAFQTSKRAFLLSAPNTIIGLDDIRALSFALTAFNLLADKCIEHITLIFNGADDPFPALIELNGKNPNILTEANYSFVHVDDDAKR